MMLSDVFGVDVYQEGPPDNDASGTRVAITPVDHGSGRGADLATEHGSSDQLSWQRGAGLLAITGSTGKTAVCQRCHWSRCFGR